VSCPAKAGHPVVANVCFHFEAPGLLDRPPFADDDEEGAV
jgi:hypothetical protein